MVAAAVFTREPWVVVIVPLVAMLYFLIVGVAPLAMWACVFKRLSKPNENYYPIFISGLAVFIASEILVVLGGKVYGYITSSGYSTSEVLSLMLALIPGYLLSWVVLKLRLKIITNRSTISS